MHLQLKITQVPRTRPELGSLHLQGILETAARATPSSAAAERVDGLWGIVEGWEEGAAPVGQGTHDSVRGE